MRAFDAYKILDEQEAGSLIDLIAPCMDDYLYIIDLKNDTLRISQSAVERFMLPDKFMNDATKHLRTLVYEKTVSCSKITSVKYMMEKKKGTTCYVV